VYYFPGQVGQGKIKWEDAAAHALFRDKVLGEWPKDEAGWPKMLSKKEEEVHVGGLVAEERHAVSGLGGSQKAEVAWLDKHGIPYKELDVHDFIDEVPAGVSKDTQRRNGQTVTQVHPIHAEDAEEDVKEDIEEDVKEDVEEVEEVSMADPAGRVGGASTGPSNKGAKEGEGATTLQVLDEESERGGHGKKQGGLQPQIQEGGAKKGRQYRSGSRFRRLSIAAAQEDGEL
jgi:hypothetical protein